MDNRILYKEEKNKGISNPTHKSLALNSFIYIEDNVIAYEMCEIFLFLWVY